MHYLKTLFLLLFNFLISSCANTNKNQFEIITTKQESPNGAIHIAVRLDKKFKENQLLLISEKIKKDFPQNERITLYCYLPDEEIDEKQPWAIILAKPTVDIQIHGVTLDEERILKGEASLITEGKIGAWIEDDLLERSYVIQQKGDLYVLTTIYPIGMKVVDSLKKRGDIFYPIKDLYGTYIIDNSDNLKIYISNKLVSVATKIE
jgi:hypothetical protein